MERRFLDFYEQELFHLRTMAAEFARQFPNVAGQLGLVEDVLPCQDPFVERMLEGFAFMAARVQSQISAEFPRFTQQLMEAVYPNFVAPLPSMAIVKLEPNHDSLDKPIDIKRGAVLRSNVESAHGTRCTFRTTQDVELWPLEIAYAEYFTSESATAASLRTRKEFKSGISLHIRNAKGQSIRQMVDQALEKEGERRFDQLTLFIRDGRLGVPILRHLLSKPAFLTAWSWSDSESRHIEPVGGEKDFATCQYVTRCGFEDDQAILPVSPRTFQGYRLLQEYFALPQRFLFVTLSDLYDAASRCESETLNLFLLSKEEDDRLFDLQAEDFMLFCTPAVNLFSKQLDRARVDGRDFEYQVVPEVTAPLDYEVHSLERVVGHAGSGSSAARGEKSETEFVPLFCTKDLPSNPDTTGYFSLRRQRRPFSERENQQGARSAYLASNVFLSLADWRNPPFSPDLRELSIRALCTNGDLPYLHQLQLREFNLVSGDPVQAKCVVQPTLPVSAHGGTSVVWRLINLLSTNYLSLLEPGQEEGVSGVAAFKEMLNAFNEPFSDKTKKQIDGLKSINANRIALRIPRFTGNQGRPRSRSDRDYINAIEPWDDGTFCIARGLEVTLVCDEDNFAGEGSGAFLFGAVMDEFLARYVSLNSFTETVIKTRQQGEIMRWPPRMGRRTNV